MLSLKVKDIKDRNAFRLLEITRIINQFTYIQALSKYNRFRDRSFFFFSKKSKKFQGSSKTGITRRCIINNRSRGVIRSFGISRIYLRELIQFGLVPGYTKAVW